MMRIAPRRETWTAIGAAFRRWWKGGGAGARECMCVGIRSDGHGRE